MAAAEKRKTILYKDLAKTVKTDGRLVFLKEVIPETLTMAEAMSSQKQFGMKRPEDEGGNDQEVNQVATMEE
jgi:hypothetical protein